MVKNALKRTKLHKNAQKCTNLHKNALICTKTHQFAQKRTETHYLSLNKIIGKPIYIYPQEFCHICISYS